MNKTFGQFMAENPNFWDSHSNYPAAVQSIVDDWFFYRELCSSSDIKFEKMFNRKLDILEEQFKDMYSKYMELQSIDPTTLEIMDRTINRLKNSEIGKVIERAIEDSVSNTRTLNTATAHTGTETTDTDATTTNALQDLRTLATSHTKTGTEDTDTTSTGTVSDSGSNSGDVQNSDYPMSSPTLGFENYVSTAQHTAGTSSNTRTDNLAGTNDTTYNTTDAESGTVTDAHTGTVTEAADTTLTHNTNIAETGTISDAAEKTTTDNTNATETGEDNENVEEIYTRKGNLIEMFEKYFSVVKRTNAIAWLLDKLEVCFIQIFDEDEESESSSSGSSEDLAELQRRVNELIVTVTKMEAGETGPYRIFDLASEMNEAYSNQELQIGSVMFVKEDDVTTINPYEDDGQGTNNATLQFQGPDGVQYSLTITVNSNLERLSPQYNSNLYTYFNQFYVLPETLTDIYDHYTIKNGYGNTVYPYYNFDNDAQPYSAELDFETRDVGHSNSFYMVDTSGDIKFLRSV